MLTKILTLYSRMHYIWKQISLQEGSNFLFTSVHPSHRCKRGGGRYVVKWTLFPYSFPTFPNVLKIPLIFSYFVFARLLKLFINLIFFITVILSVVMSHSRMHQFFKVIKCENISDIFPGSNCTWIWITDMTQVSYIAGI